LAPVLLAAAVASMRAAPGVVERRHPPPTVRLEIDVLPTAVQIDVVGELQVWNTWLGLDLSGEYILSDEDLARLRDGAVAFFAAKNRFAIDGAAVAPVVREVIPPTDFVPGRNIPDVRIRLKIALEAEPRTLGIVWEEFAATDLFERKALPAIVRYRGDVEQFVMTPTEPEYIWHTRTVLRRPPRVDPVVAAPARGVELPLPSVVLVAAAAGLLVAARRRRWPALPAVGAGVLAVGLAIALRQQGRIELAGGGPSVPGREEAFTIFQRLHGNIYRAFEAATPEEIYDLLAVSVAPDLLDQLYADVYESLVLRNQGGAVCKVEKIDVFEREVADLESRALPRFGVACGWRVHGVVSHWGHEHRRLNQYRALYTVAHDGRAWRIAAVEIKEQTRVDDNG
jgi:hypothetical protein